MLPILGRQLICFLFLAAFCSLPSKADTFKTLIIFDGANGANPVDTPLVQGTDGNLYGTTLGGGDNASGTVFKMTPAGEVTILYSFCSLTNCADGAGPYGGLVLARDGNFFGTTSQGGSGDGAAGTIFKITAAGELTTLHNFDIADGFFPNAPLIQAADGALYGVTQNGGTSNAGTFFKITPQGSLTTLFNFSGSTDLMAPLVQGSDRNFYGTSQIGGANDYGMIFKLTPSGAFSILYSFDSTGGNFPAGGLLQASDGDLYGTTYDGGSDTCPNGCGTVFKITLAGELTTLHDFDSTDGANPIAALIQATDGNFYGTTYAGGTGGDWGTVFKMTSAGVATTLHSFQGSDGGQPYGPVSQDTSGMLYGTATNGTGSASQGTAFLIATGLRPFVSLPQNRGNVGYNAGILGQGLQGTIRVHFGNVAASFKIISDTYLVATVPVGATTAFVTVATATESLKSNVPFQVLP